MINVQKKACELTWHVTRFSITTKKSKESARLRILRNLETPVWTFLESALVVWALV